MSTILYILGTTMCLGAVMYNIMKLATNNYDYEA